MGKAKRTLSVIMAALMLVFTCMTYVPANAAEAGAPVIAFVGIDHSPLVVGDTETFSLTTKNADSVQYNVVLKDAKGTVVEDLTKGYSPATAGTTPYVIKSNYVFALGKYTLAITAKRADGATTTYNAALNCVTRDNANRVYANGAVDGVKDGDVFVKNTPVTIAGIKDLGGIAGPYKYKLHVFNATTNTWTNHVQATYSDNIVWTPSEAGTYVLDIHVNTPNSTTWKNYTADPTGAVYGTYEAWKLVTVKVVDSKYSVVLSSNATNGTLVADGMDHTVVSAKFVNNLTNAVEKVDGLVAFSTTYGNLANTRVVLQDGVANVTLTSEFSAKAVTTKIDAQLIEAEDGYKDFINTSAAPLYISMAPKAAAATDAPQIVGAESNEADSITLFFDKDVTVKTFVDVDEDGEYVLDEFGYPENADGFDGLAIVQTPKDITDVQPINAKVGYLVLGYKAVPGNSKAIEVILDPATPLFDNEKILVSAEFTTSNGVRESNTSFVLTDARKPELTSAKADGLKTVVLTFSEPVVNFSGLQIDGGIVPIASALLGTFDPSDPVKGDTRNQVTVNIGNDANGQVYLKGGTHSVQVGSVSDFAALSDTKNISSTQTLDFLVPVDTTLPTATITQESPEQFRLKFNKPVTNFTIADLVMQKYNADNEAWETALPNEYVITPVGTAGQEWVIELVRDWTVILDTDNSLENYYTGDYRFFIAKHVTTTANSGVQNPANGKWNTTDIVMPLPGLKTPDVTSPVINDIAEATADNTYTVTMSEPVKLTGLDVADTVSQTQLHGVPSVLVDFIGTDKDGKVVTVHGAVVGYSATNGSDMKFNVVANENLRTVYVDNGGSKNWTLVVKNVTDDVGNAAPTLSKAFVVNPTTAAAAKFQVAHADGIHMIYGTDYNGIWDEISVEFTLPVKFTGTYENALNVANFLLDGENLPKDTLISIDLSSGTPDKGYTRIIITLPQGTIANGEIHTLDVSRYLKSASGIDLTGETEFVFTTSLPAPPPVPEP